MSTSLLFFGAFLDALIGANLFVPGEPFLLAAGYQLYDGLWYGVIAVALGGLFGDQISFFIGKNLGNKAQQRLISWQPKTQRPIARFRLLFAKKGNLVLIFARLLGPIAWVVPFLAGSQRVSWQRFTACDILGLILGIGQWILWGYLLAAGLQSMPWWTAISDFFTNYQSSLLIGLVALAAVIAYRYKSLKTNS